MNEPGGSELFESYEQDYSAISTTIARNLSSLIPQAADIDAKQQAIYATQKDIKEADDVLGNMDMELISLPSTTRSKLQPRLQSYRADLDKIKRDLRKLIEELDRERLLGPNAQGGASVQSGGGYAGDDQRARLVNGTQRLNQASNKLEQAHRMALETEAVGASTLTTLSAQRQQIMRANDTLRDADTYIDRSGRVVKSMLKRVSTNRLLSIGIIVALSIIILLILYIKIA